MQSLGFTLIEALIALLILSVALLGFVQQTHYTLQAIHGAHIRIHTEQDMENDREYKTPS